MKSQKYMRMLLVFALILTQWAIPASAASRPDTITGTLIGRVIDQAGAPMPGVRIIVTNQDTGNQRATLTNADGRYQLTFLPLGIYSIDAAKDGFVVTKPTNQPLKTALNKVINTAPEIIMGSSTVAPSQPTSTPTPTPTATASATDKDDEVGQLTNQVDATRRSNADERQTSLLPLAGIRAFDDLAFLAAGVAPPPQVKGVAGPGIGAGIGTAGQFSVNGQRARSNNFTVDGSDNNDEDVGVRRQGFVSLVPQSIESIREFQVVTHLWDAEQGRSVGSQVNAVSKSGTNRFHGTLYDFFNHSALNARNFFDYTSDKAQSYPLTALAQLADGSTQRVPVTINGAEVIQRNPSEGKDSYQRNQGGASLGFPIIHEKTFFFGSFERQDIKARQETHFSVPTVAQRGFLSSGATGASKNIPFPTFIAGDAAFSLFPFPNNPVGPYGENTFTEVLPADAEGTIFSLKFDHNFKLFGADKAHTLTGRYNFTNDRRQVPAVGGAIFSALEPRVGTQNLSLFLNSQLSAHFANQLRASYGRTRLRFSPLRDPRTLPSQIVPNDPYLLNAPLLLNLSNPNNQLGAYSRINSTCPYTGGPLTAECNLGPIGQLIITPFSPVGLDVYLFPQARTNNTYQIADTLTMFRGNHTFKFGGDIRRTQLNSFLNRNFRPQVVFGGTLDVDLFNQKLSQGGPTPGFFSGSDLAALGLPTGIFQSLAIGSPDTTVGLRFWQYNFFFNDNWRVRRGLTLDVGLRYEYNTVPREANNRIENTFRLNNLPAVDPSLGVAYLVGNRPVPLETTKLTGAFNDTIGALKNFLGGRETIFDPDRNNFGPHVGFAWDPFAGSSTQAGKTVVRGGAGVYYDVTLGSVVSQSRNVFPTFVPFNVDANTFFYANDRFYGGRESGFIAIFNPFFAPLVAVDGNKNLTPLIKPNTLNVIGAPAGALQPLLGLLFNPAATGAGLPSGGGLAFTLPDRKLRSPYALHFNLQVERELFKDYLVNVAYVGSRGLKLTRFRTPNGGPNSLTFPVDPLGLTQGSAAPLPPAVALAPLSTSGATSTRPIAGLGAFTVFDSSAASNYHSLQASVTRRFAKGAQITAAYTWSHAIDDVSDVFDMAGAFVLPQNDGNLRAERGDANFDVRHRFVFSTLSNVPFINRFNDARGMTGLALGGWQVASISTFQTGQPFTVNTSFDANFDGNLTDRLDTTNGLTLSDSRQQKIILNARPADLIALGSDGRVGRNTFRATGMVKTDLTLMKNFRVREGQTLVLRMEAFNLWNRTHFGVPVRILEAPSFGRSVDTSLNPRQVQFALKYVF